MTDNRYVLGFTGTSKLSPAHHEGVEAALETLYQTLRPQGIVTGACVGIDAFVHHWFFLNHPEVHRTVVFPGDLKAVDHSVAKTADEVIRMPSGSSYRARNTRMVELSTQMSAFWTGARRSGTFMTINIAKRAGKISREHVFGLGPEGRVSQGTRSEG